MFNESSECMIIGPAALQHLVGAGGRADGCLLVAPQGR